MNVPRKKRFIQLNKLGLFPRDFDDLVKVAFKETNETELREYQAWMQSLSNEDKDFFIDVVQGIVLRSKRKKIVTVSEFRRNMNAVVDYRYRKLAEELKKDDEVEKEPEAACSLAVLDRILLSDRNEAIQKMRPNDNHKNDLQGSGGRR